MKEELLNKIISVAYGDAGIKDKISIYFLAYKNEEIRKVYAEYKKVAANTKKLNLEECPQHIVEKVSKLTVQNKYKEQSLLLDLYSFLFRRPKFSAAIVATIVLAIVSTFIFKRPEIQNHYSIQEIEIADAQVKQSLSLVSELLHKTRDTVEKEILAERVSKPMRESLYIVNNYLQGENKNEELN